MASQSLGTLTLDLIAQVGGFVSGMDKAERSSAKWRKEVEKNAKAAGVAIGAGIAAGVTALGAITVGAINSAKEISNLSSVANTSTTEFQKYAAGAKLVGIEQEKLADIFKDVNDKVGDFLNTGGGALADFFTNIAPKVGVTADDFRNLSGPQALGLYVQSLEKANVSQADMTFYMEAIASDATALLPLLRDGSKGFKALGDAAEQAGAIMDKETIDAANRLSAAVWLIEQNATGLKNQVAKGLLPVLSKFIEGLNDTSANGLLAKVVAEDLSDSFQMLGKWALGAVAGIHLLYLGIKTLSDVDTASMKGANWWEKWVPPARFYRTFDNFDDVKNVLEQAGVKIDAAAQGYGNLLQSFDKPVSEKSSNKILEISKMLDELRNRASKPGTFTAVTNEQKASQKAAEQAAKALQSQFDQAETGYERQIALINTEVDKRKDATEVAKLQFEIESGKLKGINAQQQERLNGLAAELDRLQKLKQANEDAAKSAAYRATLQSELENDQSALDLDLVGAGMGEKARERLRQDLQIQKHYNDEQKKLAEDYRNGDISKAQLDQGTKDIEEALAQRLKAQHKYYEDTDQAQQEWMKGVDEAFQNYVDTAENHYQIAADAITGILGGATSALSDSIYDVFTGTETLSDSLGNLAATIGQTIVKAIADMAAQWLVAQAIQLIYGRTTQASAAATLAANAQATSLQAGLAAFASTAAIPIVGPALAPGAMAAALAITEPVAIAVGTSAFAGMAHDGIDAVPETGTWLLQKGERVTTAETSAKLDRTLERVQAGTARQPDFGRGMRDIIFNQYTSDPKSQQAANAKAARQIARIVGDSQRYT
ncbi:phage tail tape measure protein [Pseudomonas nicosulfuronedens]|uniref:Phage tail tape measure protein n=1 Tax=Pseudomonas nicosulfuronedens TaxID=2571105 RepID=A0A5R9QKN1_9PSED|nr:phage tail tape measure protein [Pseudomonas nicosulfuronedens]TLX69840.1 phage tail tape measure protein [Pseudomonas nicosulfuronedens]